MDIQNMVLALYGLKNESYELITQLGQMQAMADVFFCFEKGDIECDIASIEDNGDTCNVYFEGNGKKK